MIDAMEIGLEAKFNTMGVTLQEYIEIQFPEITFTIDATTEATRLNEVLLRRE